nr:HNH endonuclease [uncultured Neisseria sp.]
MAKTKYSARINGEHIDGTIEIIKRIVLHLHDMGKTQFKVKDVDEQIEELKNQWQITPDYNDDTHASLHVLSVNSNSRKHYHESMHQDFLWWKKGGIFELYKPTNFQINSTQSLEQDLSKLKEQLASEIEPEKRTEIETLIKARQGQGRFRQKLLELYPSCPLTGLDIQPLLIASHIKPWSKCNDKERLDPFNGLMLAPNIDALFDSGLITFDIDGTIKISPKINPENQKRLGISPDMKLKIKPESEEYFEYHRNHVFQKEE